VSEKLKPGLYKATVRGAAGVVVLVDDMGRGWTDRVQDNFCHMPSKITDARPLIVLDLDDRYTYKAAALMGHLRRGGYDYVADQIAEQTRPARIPEPGLWGVVSDANGNHWTNYGPNQHSSREWQSESGSRFGWDNLIDPTLIREGIS